MRWLTIHNWSLICLSCLFLNGCSMKQGAHFSIAPELDRKKIEAISQSAELRSQSIFNKTTEAVKSDQPRITGFNKQKRKQVSLQKKRNVHLVSAKSDDSELEVDDFAEFHRVELAESRFRLKPNSPIKAIEDEIPLIAEKPVLSEPIIVEISESKPVIEIAFRSNQELQAAASNQLQPETNKVEAPPASQAVDLGLKPLSQLNLKINPSKGDLPTNTAAKHWDQIPAQKMVMGESRDWSLVTKEWEAPGVAYFPLYFEEPYLERYGYNYGAIQPFISAGRFFGRIPALPYMLGAYPPDECMYSLGYARPGSCPPYQVEKLPFSWRGSVYTGLTATGLVFLIP